MTTWQTDKRKVKKFFTSRQKRGLSIPSSPWVTLAVGIELQKLLIENVINEGLTALDIGCGIGIESMFLAKQGLKVTGIDFIPETIKTAKKIAKIIKVKLDFVCADFLEFPIEKWGQKFDFIIDQGCFHHIPKKDRARYVERVYSLLSPKGLFFLRGFSEYVLPIPKYGGPIRLTSDDILNTFKGFFSVEKLYRFNNVPRLDNEKPQVFWAFLGRKRKKIITYDGDK